MFFIAVGSHGGILIHLEAFCPAQCLQINEYNVRPLVERANWLEYLLLAPNRTLC
jgi:hypothetical protein